MQIVAILAVIHLTLTEKFRSIRVRVFFHQRYARKLSVNSKLNSFSVSTKVIKMGYENAIVADI